MKIIDVSHHQGIIDWKRVREAGVEGVIIRAGYGNGNLDKQWFNNIKGVIENDFPYVGIYWFSYAYTVDMAINEAVQVMLRINQYKDKINLGVYFDWEYDSMKVAKKHTKVTKELVTNMNLAFCNTLESKGFIAGYYVNEDYQRNWIDIKRLSKFRKWYARYSSKATPTGAYLFQYSSKGQIFGINGNVDMNRLLAPKTVYEVAMEVIEGKWNNGVTRKNRLESAGYNYREVQDMVNDIIRSQIYG